MSKTKNTAKAHPKNFSSSFGKRFGALQNRKADRNRL